MVEKLVQLIILAGVVIAGLVWIGVIIQLIQQKKARKRPDDHSVHDHHEGGRPV